MLAGEAESEKRGVCPVLVWVIDKMAPVWVQVGKILRSESNKSFNESVSVVASGGNLNLYRSHSQI